MQQFALFVTKSPYDSRNAESAHAFCIAALKLGHQIKHVFFYQSGIQNASNLLSVSSDEVSMKNRWESLRHQHDVSLYVCVTAATRRGVLDQLDVNDGHLANLNPAFEVVGMSDYFAALHDSAIKSIQF